MYYILSHAHTHTHTHTHTHITHTHHTHTSHTHTLYAEEQRGLAEVITGEKHSLEMVRMSTVEEVEEKWEEELAKIADCVVDVLLARCLVDTAQALL